MTIEDLLAGEAKDRPPAQTITTDGATRRLLGVTAESANPDHEAGPGPIQGSTGRSTNGSRRAGTIVPHVFFREVAVGRGGTKAPRRIISFGKAWKGACRAAGCPGRLPHDLRRTAVRRIEPAEEQKA